MFKLTAVAFASLLALTTAVAADAAPAVDHPVDVRGGWERLGTRTVQGSVDHDRIEVGAKDGVFTALEVRVDGSSLWMDEIKITFANGETFEPKTRLVFDKNARTRPIDLPGNKRIVKHVDFKYGNLPGGGRAAVELWGKG